MKQTRSGVELGTESCGCGADGHDAAYGSGSPAFHHGDDGAGPMRKLDLLSPTPTGGAGDLAVVWGPSDEALDRLIIGLHVQGDH